MEESSRLMKQAARARAALETEAVQARDKRYIESYHQFRQAQPDYEPGKQLYSHYAMHADIYPREWGDAVDCLLTADACRMLSIIFLCQVFKSGYADGENVTGNTSAFVKNHLTILMDAAEFTEQEHQNFELVREKIERARDNMLAHADARAFQFHADEVSIRYNLHVKALDGVDFPLLERFIHRLKEALNVYLFSSAC